MSDRGIEDSILVIGGWGAINSIDELPISPDVIAVAKLMGNSPEDIATYGDAHNDSEKPQHGIDGAMAIAKLFGNSSIDIAKYSTNPKPSHETDIEKINWLIPV